jgi:glycosyltransferase involved in cell wall biosynthesis
MNVTSTKYIIISPVRNEEKNIEYTIQSVCAQSIKPARWIIVDDGSSDRTADIIKKYAFTNNWISLLQLADRGYYDLNGGGEIKAFYQGYQRIKDDHFAFLVKLDGDISFDQYYFEKLLKEFHSNKRLGVASGALYHIRKDNQLIPETTYKHHPRGAARVYRRECWEDIGGVKDKLTWDSIDVYKARMLGWDTYNFENITAIHHVKTWEKGGLIRGLIRAGRLQYLMGTHTFFFAAKVIKRTFAKPHLIGAGVMLYGYLKSYLAGEERVPEPELMEYIRKEQLKRLGLGR